MGKTIQYGDELVYVSDEVAEFLDSDRKRQEAQSRSDRRHLSKSDFETVLSAINPLSADGLVRHVIKNLTLEKLHSVLASLPYNEQQLVDLYYFDEARMDEIGERLGGISKMAVSKRHKKLLAKLRSLMET